MKPLRHRSFMRAFTLVELVVAITLIVLMWGLLTPAMGRARSGCRRSACVSNARQIGLAFKQYAADNGDRFPTNGSSISIATSSLIFPSLTNGNYLAIGKIYICAQDRGRTPGTADAFGSANNSYACVVADAGGRTGLTEAVSADNPLIFDRGLTGAPAPVHTLTNGMWLYRSPHHDTGGNIFYVGGQAAFKRTFDSGGDGTNGFILEP